MNANPTSLLALPHIPHRRSNIIRDLLGWIERPGMLSLAGGAPDPRGFPTERIASSTERVLSTKAGNALQYGPTEGAEALRIWVAGGSAIHDAAGNAENVVITAGSQQGLDLVARVVLGDGAVVAAEDPLYLGARQAFDGVGATIIALRTDDAGIDPEHLADALQAGLRPTLLYTVPHYSNPSGATLPAERRMAIAELARRFGFLILEDDPYAALGFGCLSRVESFASMAPEVTISLGSVSKILAPGFRVGWLRAPKLLAREVAIAKQSVDLHTSSFSQAVVADLLTDDEFLSSHVAALRGRYEPLAAALHTAVANSAKAARPRGGLFVWAHFPGVDTAERLDAALNAGVAYIPGTAFSCDGARHKEWARLTFATLDTADLIEAVGRMNSVFG